MKLTDDYSAYNKMQNVIGIKREQRENHITAYIRRSFIKKELAKWLKTEHFDMFPDRFRFISTVKLTEDVQFYSMKNEKKVTRLYKMIMECRFLEALNLSMPANIKKQLIEYKILSE